MRIQATAILPPAPASVGAATTRVPSLARHMRALAVALMAAASVLAPALLATPARAEEAALDRWPSERAQDPAALQRGVRLFASYCLNCHGARQMRWNRLRDIGIDDVQIKQMLIFGDQKVGDVMSVSMNAHDAKVWFGKAPPDLSVIIRARSTEEHRGTDYVYTLLRSFYRDRSTLTGWNNAVYPHIAMPNILWQRMGPRTATITHVEWEDRPAADPKQPPVHELAQTVSVYDPDGYLQTTRTVLENGTPGTQVVFTPVDPKAAAAVDDEVADLVAYLNWMSEPAAASRYRIGIWVMGFLFIFLLVVHWLNKVYWRDIK